MRSIASGGLYLGPTVCLLPTAIADPTQLARIQTRVTAAGGTFDVFEIESFAPVAEARLRSRCNEARADEYAEIVEQSEAIVAELEREGAVTSSRSPRSRRTTLPARSSAIGCDG